MEGRILRYDGFYGELIDLKHGDKYSFWDNKSKFSPNDKVGYSIIGKDEHLDYYIAKDVKRIN